MRDRVFKSNWFTKRAAKFGISDSLLRETFYQIKCGQCSNLGGGVFKKRLNKNLYRSILLVARGNYFMFVYLYAKKQRASISAKDLIFYRDYARLWEKQSTEDIERNLFDDGFTELILHDENEN